jgi:hypothetical protein
VARRASVVPIEDLSEHRQRYLSRLFAAPDVDSHGDMRPPPGSMGEPAPIEITEQYACLCAAADDPNVFGFGIECDREAPPVDRMTARGDDDRVLRAGVKLFERPAEGSREECLRRRESLARDEPGPVVGDRMGNARGLTELCEGLADMAGPQDQHARGATASPSGQREHVPARDELLSVAVAA